MTNDFIQQSNGVIVTEYCKKLETWEKYKSIPYECSVNFKNDLINLEDVMAEELSAKKDERKNIGINYEIEVYKVGSESWLRYLNFGHENKLLNEKKSAY